MNDYRTNVDAIFVDGLVARFEVSKCVWPYMAFICIVYFVTLSLFPGIESEIVSCRLGSWMPVVLIAVFNLFDFIGKVCCRLKLRSHWMHRAAPQRNASGVNEPLSSVLTNAVDRQRSVNINEAQPARVK